MVVLKKVCIVSLLMACIYSMEQENLSELGHIVVSKDRLRYELSLHLSGLDQIKLIIKETEALEHLLKGRELVTVAGSSASRKSAYPYFENAASLKEGEISDEACYWLGVMRYEDRYVMKGLSD